MEPADDGLRVGEGQKAPSAKRCIKTVPGEILVALVSDGQKAPSAKRCIKTCFLFGKLFYPV